jgi:hypothetical protein
VTRVNTEIGNSGIKVRLSISFFYDISTCVNFDLVFYFTLCPRIWLLSLDCGTTAFSRLAIIGEKTCHVLLQELQITSLL